MAKKPREILCDCCGKKFYSTSPTAKYCVDCRYNHKKIQRQEYMKNKRHPNKTLKYKNKSLDETLADIRRYNKANGTNYSYGEYIGRRDSGWLQEKK